MNYNLIKSADFCGTQCDIYSDDANEMFMTAFQLGSCLGYTNPQKAIDNLISRNKYLKTDEFSVTLKMRATDGKQYDTRIFTEDGIYEVTMLAKTEKAKEFRTFVRQLIKSIRKGETLVVSTAECSQTPEDKSKTAEAKLLNARTRMANMYLKLANIDTVSKEYKNILVAKSAEVLSGQPLLPLPKSEQKTYSAGDIGKMFGVSAQKVGIVAKANGMKTEEYGEWYHDKSPYSNKEVDAFRYNDKAIEKFRSLL